VGGGGINKRGGGREARTWVRGGGVRGGGGGERGDGTNRESGKEEPSRPNKLGNRRPRPGRAKHGGVAWGGEEREGWEGKSSGVFKFGRGPYRSFGGRSLTLSGGKKIFLKKEETGVA